MYLVTPEIYKRLLDNADSREKMKIQDLNKTSVYIEGLSPLNYAIKYNNIELALALIEKGADGLSVGSLFIASNESDVSDDYKNACVEYGEDDIEDVSWVGYKQHFFSSVLMASLAWFKYLVISSPSAPA